MSVALTPFDALCGFRPLPEIRSHLKLYPELADIVGATGNIQRLNKFNNVLIFQRSVTQKLLDINLEDIEGHNSANNRALLKELFACFMHAPDELVNAKIAQLIGRISIELEDSSALDSGLNDINNLIIHLNNDFADDRGVLCPLLLNYVRLKAGEAFFMGANEPHAYLSGDCLECMALSDNTVRAGLTPKHRDVDTLINMLHYR